MSKPKGNTIDAPTWRDIRNGRKHKLITRELERKIPPLGSSDKVADIDEMPVHVKLFCPYSEWTWYIAELDPETGTCFGLVDGPESEVGYFDLADLAKATLGYLPAVERDLYWMPKTIGRIRKPNS